MHITLIRHAQAETNTRPDLIGGYQPLAPLTEQGIIQAQFLGARLKREGILEQIDGNIYSSPAIRTRETARFVLNILGRNPDTLITDERLRELGQGDWENQTRNKIYTQELKETLDKSCGSYRPPNGESQIDVSDRMEDWLISLETQKHHLAFSRGMAINCLVQRLIGLPPGSAHKHELTNTGITELKEGPFGWSLIRHNDCGHLSVLKNKR